MIINSYFKFYPAPSVDFLFGVPKLLIYRQISYLLIVLDEN